MKRLRVIRRDLKSFVFELVLPFGIIILALTLLKLSFIFDFETQAISVDTYLNEQNPVIIPIGSDNAAFANLMQTSISNHYGSKVSVPSDVNDLTAANFDHNFLFPKKLSQKTLKGGIFFNQATSTSPGGSTVYSFTTLTQTRSPTSPFFLGALASETFLNQVLGKQVTIKM